MKLKKKMKRMLEANLMNVILATEIKETDDSFLRDFITRILITAILHL